MWPSSLPNPPEYEASRPRRFTFKEHVQVRVGEEFQTGATTSSGRSQCDFRQVLGFRSLHGWFYTWLIYFCSTFASLDYVADTSTIEIEVRGSNLDGNR